MQHLGRAPGQLLRFSLVAAALRASLGSCRSLRTGKSLRRTLSAESLGIDAVRNESIRGPIKEKWDKMDEFLKIMFSLACQWKHGKDINGAAAEKLQNGELDPDEVEGYKKQLQAENLKAIPQVCGKMTAIGKEKCRSGCSERWGEAMQQRSDCDEKCVTVYDRFGKTCNEKAENLEKVYEMKLSDATARKRCYEGFCPKHPTVWMVTQGEAQEETVAAMKTERDKQCEAGCTAEKIALDCQRKWQLKVDFIKSDITSSCFGEGQVKECFEGKKETASSTQETCSTDGKQECSTQFDTCKAEGKTDATFKEAEEFCTERKKMCESQVVDRCLQEFKTALDSAKQECEHGDSEAMKQCESESLAEAETDAMAECESEETPNCKKTCENECPVEDLYGCLSDLTTELNPGKDFCEDFWNLLHGSSEVDPVTGDPVVLLAN